MHSIEDTPEGQVYRESVDSFNEKYNGKYFADIEFIPRNDSGGGYSDKVNSSVLSGGLPDVLTLDGPNAVSYTHLLANAISCVTMIIVSPSFASVRITSRTSPTICGSRAEVGLSLIHI